MVAKDQIRDVPDDKLVIATTGAQGEPMSGLARMANRDHRFVEIQPGDTVIVSASPIPGNEEYVSRTIDNLFKAGANVFYHTIKRAHVSGHGSQEELKLMLGLTKPSYFIPIHGEFRMQVQHGRLAIETGVAARERLHHRERHAHRDPARRLRPARHAASRPATSSSTGCPWARSASRAARSPRPRQRRHVHGRRPGRQADRQRRRPARDHHPWLRARQREGPDDRRGGRSRDPRHREPGRPHQRGGAAQEPRSRTACRATSTSGRSAARWSSRSWWRSGGAAAGHVPPAGPVLVLAAASHSGLPPTGPVPSDVLAMSLVRLSGSACWRSAR